MGFITTSTAAGQGSLSLGGLVTVNEVCVHVLAFATGGHRYGVTPVRRYFNQAWYGVGFTPGAGPTAGLFIVTFAKFSEYDTETTLFPTGDHRPADTLYWDIPPNGLMYLEVDWD